jgi:hypothetical protein
MITIHDFHAGRRKIGYPDRSQPWKKDNRHCADLAMRCSPERVARGLEMESGLMNDREAMTEADAIVFVVDDNGMRTEPERSDRLLLSHG